MSFTKEGTHNVQITEAFIAECKFEEAKSMPNSFSVYLKVEGEDGEDYWEGECSNRFGVGNNANKTRYQMTVDTLTKLGVANGDISQIQTLVNTQTQCGVKASSNGKYMNVSWIGGSSYRPEAMGQDEFARRLAALQGQQQQPAAQFTPQQPQQPAQQQYQQPAQPQQQYPQPAAGAQTGPTQFQAPQGQGQTQFAAPTQAHGFGQQQ